MEQSSNAIFLIDCATRNVVQCNAAFCRLLGYSSAEALQLDAYAISASERKAVDERIELVELNAAAHLGLRTLRKKNGAVVEVELSATVVSMESGNALALTAQDMSERKCAELEQSRLREAIVGAAVEWRETFDAITSPILVVDRELRVLRLNAAAHGLLHGESNQAFRTTLSGSKSELWQCCSRQVEAALATHEMQQGRSRDDEGRQIEIKVTPAKNDTAIVLLVDMSELHGLQDSLRQSETLSALGSLVAGVAHEVRNPLFSIGATLDAFEGRFSFTAEQSEYVRILRGELARLNCLMRDLLTYGRAHTLDKTACEFPQLINSAVELNRAQAALKDVEIRVQQPAKLPRIDVDGQRMITVLRNLIENAVQHAPPGTTIDIEVRAQEAQLQCSVRDHGRGFSEAALLHALEPFFSKRAGGTGLGLAIVQRVVLQHGGEAHIGNHPRGGGVVSITLPG